MPEPVALGTPWRCTAEAAHVIGDPYWLPGSGGWRDQSLGKTRSPRHAGRTAEDAIDARRKVDGCGALPRSLGKFAWRLLRHRSRDGRNKVLAQGHSGHGSQACYGTDADDS